MAFARPALRRRGTVSDLESIAALARGEGAEVVVLGLPRNMDGSEGPQAAAARHFGERLAATGRRPDRRSGELDSAAARLILQEYLDAHPNHPSPEAE